MAFSNLICANAFATVVRFACTRLGRALSNTEYLPLGNLLIATGIYSHSQDDIFLKFFVLFLPEILDKKQVDKTCFLCKNLSISKGISKGISNRLS